MMLGNQGDKKTKQIGIFLYDGASTLDFVGVSQVFAGVSKIRPGSMEMFTFALRLNSIRTDEGFHITPECSFNDIPEIDLMIVPGGEGRRVPMSNPIVKKELKKLSERSEFVIGISTGALILGAADILRTRQATTHWLGLREFQKIEGIIPYPGKIVRSGRTLTCAGGSLGIDLAIYLVKEIYGSHMENEIRNLIEHKHSPIEISIF